ncbi:putative esterase C31F10.02 [Ceratocystis lukuohia]|uniref:Esterase C31F10.02 n=3 Tax=Ceratocystis TaxID=5157 RepID=A0ABR4MS87_9PEZI|nr:putative esterase C31F10.02 [Ceratocystis platani]PHH51089.1 putative esterase C31F10.02 [Ceratocystis fimbriata CBS 114723]
MASRLQTLPFVRAVWHSFKAESGLEPRLLGDHFRITNAAPGKVEFELAIQQQHTNRMTNLHGGTIASIVDLGGSLAVASTGRFSTGVSTDINVSYLSSGGKVGDVLKGLATCEKIGKTLAYTSVQFWNAKGQLAARGSHTKYVAGTLKDESEAYVAPNEYVDNTT